MNIFMCWPWFMVIRSSEYNIDPVIVCHLLAYIESKIIYDNQGTVYKYILVVGRKSFKGLMYTFVK